MNNYQLKKFLYISILVLVAAFLYNKFYQPSNSSEVKTIVVSTLPQIGLLNKKPSLPSHTYRSIKPSKINITSPTNSKEWVIDSGNIISWDKASGETGAIFLLSYPSREIIGWITSNTGPTQSSFRWSTRDIFLTRYSGVKKNISVGQYLIKIKFDESGREVESGMFSIIYPSQVKRNSYSVVMYNFIFSPKILAINQGDNVNFVNNDNVVHRVFSPEFGPFTLKPNENFVFDTAFLTAGNYNYYDDNYGSMNGTLIVK